MRLREVIAVVLVGAALFFAGCGSDKAETPSRPDGMSQKDAAEQTEAEG